MIDSPNTDEQGLKADEARLSKLQREKERIEAASHCGFTDAICRTRLVIELAAAETAVLHKRVRLAARSQLNSTGKFSELAK
jgi:hypothetical protein